MLLRLASVSAVAGPDPHLAPFCRTRLISNRQDSAFNQPLMSLDTSNVTAMYGMFEVHPARDLRS